MDVTQVNATVRRWLAQYSLEDSELDLPYYEDGIWVVGIYTGNQFGSVLIDDSTEEVLENQSFPLDTLA